MPTKRFSSMFWTGNLSWKSRVLFLHISHLLFVVCVTVPTISLRGHAHFLGNYFQTAMRSSQRLGVQPLPKKWKPKLSVYLQCFPESLIQPILHSWSKYLSLGLSRTRSSSNNFVNAKSFTP